MSGEVGGCWQQRRICLPVRASLYLLKLKTPVITDRGTKILDVLKKSTSKITTVKTFFWEIV